MHRGALCRPRTRGDAARRGACALAVLVAGSAILPFTTGPVHAQAAPAAPPRSAPAAVPGASTQALAVCVAEASLGPARAAARLDALLAELAVPAVHARPLRSGAASHGAPRAGARIAAPGVTGPSDPHPLDGWFVLEFASSPERDAAARALAGQAGWFAEPVRTIVLDGTPAALAITAGAYGAQASVAGATGEIPPNVRQVRAPEALAGFEPARPVVVAIVDTGADLEHPDLSARLWRNDDPPGNASAADDATDQNGDGQVDDWERDDDDNNGYVDDLHGYDFTDAPGAPGLGDARDRDPDPSDDQGHGTHVAGIVAADGTLSGVAPFATVQVLRAAYATPFGGALETDDAAAAIVYAADNGADVLNLSWGDAEESRLVHAAVEYALDRGVVVIAAAGNGGSAAPHYPSAQAGVIAVGSVDEDDQPSSFSNRGSEVALWAPGELFAGLGGGIESLAPGGGRARRRGTSMAAPHVAGIAAILLSEPQVCDAATVHQRLLDGARQNGGTGGGDAEVPVADAVGARAAAADVVIEIAGPARAWRAGRLHLVGTVAGRDLARWRVDARTEGSDNPVPIVAWQTARVVAGTLADTVFAGASGAGAWEWIVTAVSGAGTEHIARGPFEVDATPPRVETLHAIAGWRAGSPRWLVGARADEEVALAVTAAPSETLAVSEPGWSRTPQAEVAPDTRGASLWRVQCENPAGLARDTTIAALPALPAWPEGARLRERDRTSRFRPEPLVGRAPDGTALVWGNGITGDTLGAVQAWAAEAGRLALRHDTGRTGRAAALADANGDGADDLLLQHGDRIDWLVSRGPATFPDSVAGTARAERVLGGVEADGDAGAEMLLSSRDSLFLYDDVRAGPPRRLAAVATPGTGGFDVLGGDAATGDIDGDGRIEVVCGDAEGFLFVYEIGAETELVHERTIDTGGSYAYDLCARAGGGFLAGFQRTQDVTGDGFPVAAWAFRIFGPDLEEDATNRWDFFGPTNRLAAGSAFAASSATDAEWLALVHGGDLYVLRRAATLGLGRPVSNEGNGGESWAAEVHAPEAAGEPPAWCDLDGDGGLDLVLRTPAGCAWWSLDEDRRGPHGLAASSLGARAVALEWSVDPGDTVRVLRAPDGGAWDVLGTTTSTAWVDSTAAVAAAPHRYQVQALGGGTSNVVRVRAQPLPRLLSTAPLGEAAVRVHGSNRWSAAAADPRRWSVRVGDVEVQVVRAAIAGAGREVHLVLEAPLPCGAYAVGAQELRDDQGGALDPGGAQVSGTRPCGEPFYVRAARLESSSTFVLEYSRAPDPATITLDAFRLAARGASLALARFDFVPPESVRLHAAPGVVFEGWGFPYTVAVDASVRAAGDGTPLLPSELWLRAEGRGATAVVAAPNPVHAGAEGGVVFLEARADTRIEIYDLEGQRVRTLAGSVGGGIHWDLRNASGEPVVSGPYIYLARDASGQGRGTVVVLR